eukprot:218871-Chlamydomonas_euryale.AAC.1
MARKSLTKAPPPPPLRPRTWAALPAPGADGDGSEGGHGGELHAGVGDTAAPLLFVRGGVLVGCLDLAVSAADGHLRLPRRAEAALERNMRRLPLGCVSPPLAWPQ